MRILLASLLARAPQGMGPLAIVLLVQERTGSIAAAGLASGAWGLGVAVGQTVWARPAGRGRAALVLAAVSSAQAAGLLLLGLAPWTGSAVGVALAGGSGLLGAPVTSVARTLWPELTRSPQALERLFTLDATSQEVVWIAGPALVAALVALYGSAPAVLATAVAGSAGGLAVARAIVPVWHARPARSADAPPFLRHLLVPFLGNVVLAVGLGLTEVGVPAAAILDGQRDAAGWLLAVWSTGSLVGGLGAARRPSARPPQERLPVLLAALTAGAFGTVLAWPHGLAWLAVALFFAGVPLAPAFAAVYGVVSAAAPAQRRTEAFAVGTTFVLFGLAVGAALGGVLSERSPTFAFLASAACTAVAAVTWTAWRQRERTTRASSKTGVGDS